MYAEQHFLVNWYKTTNTDIWVPGNQAVMESYKIFVRQCLRLIVYRIREQKGSTGETKIINKYFNDIKLQNPVTMYGSDFVFYFLLLMCNVS
jgi:hypothetical protein